MIRLSLVAATLFTLSACNSPKGDKAEATEKQEAASTSGLSYVIDTTSLVTWTGSKPTGQHTGTFVVNGTLAVNENNLTGGSFNIDINSLKNLDLKEDDGKSKLEGHLKSADFFDVAKFPKATFEITSVESYSADSTEKTAVANATHRIKGNLTLKDSTKNISFPARVSIDASKLTAEANVNIDRTQWGMNYKGPNNPQDWFISKEVNLKLNINAAKQ